MATKVKRPLEWMRFDPVEFGLLCDGLTFAQVGALTKVMLHLWQKGPLSDADIRRVAKGEADAICELLRQHGDGLSLDLVEEAREHGKRRVTQRVEAGKASAAKRNERSTTVEQPMNDRSADVLSMSISKSTSKSESNSQERKERAKQELQWPAFAGEKVKAKWAEFIQYRLVEKKERYKTIVSEQRALNLAAKYFPTGRMFVEGLDHAMARTWLFPVDPSEHKYPFTAEAKPQPMSTLKPWIG